MNNMNQQPMNQKPGFMPGAQAGNIAWQDQDMITDLISTEKWLSSTYANSVVECTCQNLRQVLTDNFNTINSDQYSIFDQMRQRNWYPVQNAQPQDVNTAKQKFTQMKSQITQ